MGRGKKVDIDEYITNIEEYLQVGCSINEACLHGLVPYTTVIDYYNNDEDVRNKIDRLQNTPILKARQGVVKTLENNPELALKYLERKKKDEFSLRHETTGADGREIKVNIINYGDDNDTE